MQGWQYEPHPLCPFQKNAVDCGVYMLLFLKQLAIAGTVGNCDAVPKQFHTPEDGTLTGQRLALAQELLNFFWTKPITS